jgi:hypothetical protein
MTHQSYGSVDRFATAENRGEARSIIRIRKFDTEFGEHSRILHAAIGLSASGPRRVEIGFHKGRRRRAD